jgi:quercetin dioxygenase-like cupin family protein
MKTKILFAAAALWLSSFHVLPQGGHRPDSGRIASYIDRFELRPSDMHSNGWSHYYIPRGMGDTLTVKMSCVYIGRQTHAPHTHHEDEAFYIISGPVVFHINGEERILHTGDFVYTPSGSSHNIRRTNETDTIKYLVLKRETVGALERPYAVGKTNYMMDDCCTHPDRNAAWVDADKDASVVLLDRLFADGFQVVMHRTTNNSNVFRNDATHRHGQVAIYILGGEAEVTLDGDHAQIGTDNTLYCPAGSAYSLRKTGDTPLIFLTVTTQ